MSNTVELRPIHPAHRQLRLNSVLPRCYIPLILLAIFAASVVIRLPLLNRPLSHPREWLTATVLRHLEIWHEMGIAQAHFAPITTYPGAANRNINNEASEHKDAAGNYYYTSFPPFAYYVPYFVFEVMHVAPGVLPLQIFGVCTHFVSGLLVFLSARLLLKDEPHFFAAAVIAYTLYIFSPFTLWLQANIYMSDIFAQVFFVAGIYLTLRWVKSGSEGLTVWLFGLVTFCFVYTEWLGVLFAVSVILYLWREGARRNRRVLITIALAASAALLLTAWQYSQISGFHAFLNALQQRFAIRSGLGQQDQLNFHVWHPLGWLFILTYYVLAYGADLLLLVLWGVLGRDRTLNLSRNIRLAIFSSAVAPVIMHHLLLFNFTAAHEFSVLKAAPFLAIIGGLLAAKLWNAPAPILRIHPRVWVCASLLLCCTVCLWQYSLIVGPETSAYKNIGDFIARNALPDEIVFAEYQRPSTKADRPLPQIVYYAHRNIAIWTDESYARNLSRMNGVPKIAVFTINPAETQVVAVRRMNF